MQNAWAGAARLRQGSVLSIAFATLAIASPAAALLPQSWNGYHWARTGPLVISLASNVSSAWTSYLQTAAPQWSAANNIDFLLVGGTQTVGASTCNPVYGSVQVCSGSYGFNGWLGYANVWTGGGHIVQATVRLNDSYFSSAKYNTPAWRSMTMCQEVGHTLGLDHTNVIRTNANTGSCMDYTNNPLGGGTLGLLQNLQPNSADFLALDGIYSHLDATQLSQTKPRATMLSGHGFSIDGDEIETVTFVPEPGVWAMMMAGFGIVGAGMRRQRPSRRALAN